MTSTFRSVYGVTFAWSTGIVHENRVWDLHSRSGGLTFYPLVTALKNHINPYENADNHRSWNVGHHVTPKDICIQSSQYPFHTFITPRTSFTHPSMVVYHAISQPTVFTHQPVSHTHRFRDASGTTPSYPRPQTASRCTCAINTTTQSGRCNITWLILQHIDSNHEQT